MLCLATWEPHCNDMTSAFDARTVSHKTCTHNVEGGLDRTNWRHVFGKCGERRRKGMASSSCCITTARAIVDSMTGSRPDPGADNEHPRDTKESGNKSRPVNEYP
jgi:hypothetical protein